jgi:DNA-binding transcriptional LysR family regulator
VAHAKGRTEHSDSIYWTGFHANNNLAAVLTVLADGSGIWWNTRLVARHEHALVDLWAQWHIEHGSLFVVLWKRDLAALRD